MAAPTNADDGPRPPLHGAETLPQADERMRSVVNHVIDGIVSIDERGTITTFNPAAERIFGYRAAEVFGQNVRMLMPDPYRAEHDGYIHNYLGTGQAKIIGIGREVMGQRKDRSVFPMELAISEFRFNGERHFTGITRDITERKRMEHELQERLRELAEADRQKNEFLAMLAHELRNPLAPMRNALHVLSMPDVPEDSSQRALGMMGRQLNHLIRLVDDLLDVSRIIQGKIELRNEVVDIGSVVNRAVETAQPMIDARRHRLKVALPDQAVYVHGDPLRLAQVIANLLTNASKYSPPESPIELTVLGEAGQAVIQVRDRGIGIAPEVLPEVFGLFVQADASLARSEGGLGVGLTLVKRLAEMHGGSVSAASDGLGKGSAFTIRLPLMPDEDACAGVPEGEAHARVTDALRKRVLVVDDNVDAAESVAMILRLSGYDVRCTYDGVSALDAAKAYHPDVVVLDIGLPGISGYEVARRLRLDPEFEDTPLVAVTGYGQEADRRRSEKAGIDYHLTKPVDPATLQQLLSKPPHARPH
ncbi:MAG TPA: PAS domain S-box protein [Burkholderiaceae bacterium]|nr:PAS domain S-box protein [Burkholderiaceae bacterium]